MTETLVVTSSETDLDVRAVEVLEQIGRIKTNLHEGLFDLAELLAEARSKSFHVNWGFARFGDWVEQGSGLDIAARTAYYLICIVEKGKLLGIPRNQLRAVKMSKLKEIFSLDAGTNGETIKQLVGQGQSLSLDEVRNAVNQVKTGAGLEPLVYMTVKLPKSVKQIVDDAFEIVRRNYGDKLNEYGEPFDLSDSGCLELICAEYLTNPNSFGEQP